MSVGASNIDPATHPLLSSLYFGFSPRQTSFTYSFAPAGDVVDKAGYVGGSDFTRAWTQEEEAIFRSIAARFSQVAQIAFVEVGTGTGADINLQIVEEVAGGFGGYASTGGETYVVGDAEPGLLTHELGHTAYLDHPFDGTTLPGVGDTFDPGDFGLNSTYYSIMAYRSGTPNGFGSLTDMPANVGLAALDIAMLQALYGANTTFAAGADTYGAQTAFHTIWDAGGYDTLDYSTASGNSRIDLRAATLEVADGGGGFVSLLNVTGGGAAGGYTIAYGVTIEAGLGGSGDDTLIGNGAANLLRGGLGNDTLHGGGGNDRLDGAQPGAAILPITLAELNTAGGANGRALRVEDYSLPGDFTLDMAVRIDPGTNALQTLVDHAPATSGAPGFELRLWTDDFPSLWLVLRNPGNSFSVQFSGITKEAIADGDFHRVTLTRDTASGEMRVYLDGVFMRAETYRPGEVMAPDSVLSFGQRGVGINPLNGDMGPVAVHDTRLSDQDIAARSLSDLADPAESGLLSYWVPGGAGSTGGVIADQTGGPGLAMTGGATLFTVPLNTDDDLLRGEGGNDTLTGGLGNDTLDGGTQDDRLRGGRATTATCSRSTLAEAIPCPRRRAAAPIRCTSPTGPGRIWNFAARARCWWSRNRATPTASWPRIIFPASPPTGSNWSRRWMACVTSRPDSPARRPPTSWSAHRATT